MLSELWIAVVVCAQVLWAEMISSVGVWPKSVFPVELGESVTWLFTPKGGSEYDTDSMISFEIEGAGVYRIQRTRCAGPFEKYFTCTHKPQNEISVSFTPTEEMYGKEVTITYFKDTESLWARTAPPLLRELIQLTKQPTYVEMEMDLKEASRHTPYVPTGLRLDPPIFLTGSHVRIDCSSDGSLPPVPISFSIECPPPPTAVVEHDRVTQAKQSLSYEQFYRTYGFRSPPTLADLAPYVARKHASQLLRLGHVAVGKDNKTLRATLSITEKAHDCHVVCRLAGKETRRRLTVYYPTTIAYLLPRPRDGYVQVGSEITCYADGHPPPMLSLRLAQPLRPPKPLTEEELEALRQVGRLPKTQEDDPVNREILLSNSGINVIPEQLAKGSRPVSADEDPALASSATLQQLPHESRGWFTGPQKEPFEEARRIPGLGLSTIERHRLLGLHPNEYSIQGATFRLAPNATPGIELSLTCTARNVLPGDTTFLGMNGTVTRTRFVVSAVSYTSLAISLGVCACVLLVLLVIIAAMLLQRRRQPQSDTDRLAANGTKKARAQPRPLYTKGQQMARPGAAPTSRLVDQPSTQMLTNLNAASSGQVPLIPNNSYINDPNYQYDAVYSSSHMVDTAPRSSSLPHPDASELQYVELAFDQNRPSHHQPTSGRPGTSSLRGGPTYASMTLFGTSPRRTQPTRTYGASVPQGLNVSGDVQHPAVDPRAGPAHGDETSSHYTEIVGFMQPKAYSSQLVLQQQQEATQALLGMHQNKPRIFV
ncbi:hypothetical protein CRM22_002402 [Opisthorchis felineus]|uniref:CUB domain-containing protein n=1 Tax=Opisthorchis felineus TaxID=147828 RepID=A0A4S2M6C9_OPIFE|nr:hypothetical protein CRM22_002402 [Opisthorchis felineus]